MATGLSRRSLEAMVLLSSEPNAQASVPANPAQTVQAFVFGEVQLPHLEETLTKMPVILAGDTPGNLHGDPVECCRTEICTCTRAVPHGSFL